MRRSRSDLSAISLLVLPFVLACMPVAARTSPLHSPGDVAAECPEVAAEPGEQLDPIAKAIAAKRGTAPAAAKSRPATRGADAPPVRAPRWHRFIPGMYR